MKKVVLATMHVPVNEFEPAFPILLDEITKKGEDACARI